LKPFLYKGHPIFLCRHRGEVKVWFPPIYNLALEGG
jgi:hypothetical protein